MSRTPPSPLATLARALDIYDSQMFEMLPEILAEDIDYRVAGERFTGRAEVLSQLQGIYGTIPDLRHEIVSAVVDGNRIAAELHISGTHTGGPFVTSLATVDTTGLPVEWVSGSFLEIDDDRIASWHIFLDQAPILLQLGFTV